MLDSDKKNQSNLTRAVFIKKNLTDYSPVKKGLERLIAKKLNKFPENYNSEDKSILIEIEKILSQGKISDTVLGDKGIVFSFSPQEFHWLAKHPQNKWLEYIIYRYQFKIFPKQKKLLDFPLYLLIEPTSICNLRCTMCFQTDKSFRKKEFMGMMSWELFTKLADQAKDNDCRAITLASRGEPTLHSDFGKMLHYLNDAGILDIKINTNATRLNEKIINDILSAGVSECVFSIDAADKETYEKIRVGANFEKVVANVRLFHKIREKNFPNSSTITRVSGVDVDEKQNKEEIIKFWSEIVDELTINTMNPRWDTYNNKIMDNKEPCTQLWRQMYIWYDGIANPCDFDYESYLKVGDANRQTIKEIWTGENYNQLRNDHLNKQRAKHLPCDRCPLN